jgi:hypothetical protein
MYHPDHFKALHYAVFISTKSFDKTTKKPQKILISLGIPETE